MPYLKTIMLCKYVMAWSVIQVDVLQPEQQKACWRRNLCRGLVSRVKVLISAGCLAGFDELQGVVKGGSANTYRAQHL